ncbi:MAG TPA: Do family serine endopeptidase [Caulobacteraceae bacterium]|nr:Do family serine endopeptidase [Caulobacteraceae bacterium]
MKTGFLLGAVAGAGLACAALVGAGFQPAGAWAQDGAVTSRPSTPTPPPSAAMSFADVFARVSPAVVSINVKTQVDTGGLSLPGFGNLQPAPKAPKDGQGGDPNDQGAPSDGGGKSTALATGSGFFISADGYIVTNNHVIENATDIKVVLPDASQTELPAKVIGRDEATDLAVLKVEGKDYPYVSFENSARPRVGDWVIAVGNPFGLGGTATAGIISAYGRDIGEKFVDYIQIDAPINRGNSGGPSFDVYGRVIGINSAIFSPSGGSVGIGFAIPADVADTVTKQLIASGKITRGYLGATIQDVSPEIAESLGKPDLKGALVDELSPGGPAEKAGVKAGDIVLSLNGSVVKGATDLTRQVAASHTGDPLRLAILRDGQNITIEAHSGLRPSEEELAKAQGQGGGGPAPDQGGAKPGVLGLNLAPLDPATRRKFDIPAEVTGVVVTDLDADSDAAAKGVKAGDVVIRVNQRAVSTPADVAAEVADAIKAKRANVLLFLYHDHRQAAVPILIAPDADAPSAKGRKK